ncbi:chloramphenicol-sensitive protein RarD [Tropicibacter naphthalenivorans]|uniref:Putative chloramphenical resistance permease RarD n=2 Tax=Tropicibacter naphthalenivorans TaxID=441103 RepID=A0A0P1GVA0_9RHOB|nr:putative chloramphenical resistance permease RarD [Tropicibacter naphthalenivorans]SMC83562.1 chloramphenicol-sensitive protein RarD [Tropicibacter naphthalenivorans]
MIGACSIWGLSPLYYKLLTHVPPLELMAHRTVWSTVVFAGVLALQGDLRALRGAVASPRVFATVVFAALMVGCNWFLFIWSVIAGRVTETSLGYYIFPLIAVLLGVVVLRERLSLWQWGAVSLAAAGVLTLSIGLGILPWISLVLSTTFGLYGLVKKRLPMGPVASVTAEAGLLAVPAALWLIHVGPGGAGIADLYTLGLLIFSGIITALPLVLFTAAAQRVNMATVGLLQYLNPTLQFLCAVVIFGEAFTPVHAIAFGLIWAGLALYSASSLSQAKSLAQERARRKMAQTSDASLPY